MYQNQVVLWDAGCCVIAVKRCAFVWCLDFVQTNNSLLVHAPNAILRKIPALAYAIAHAPIPSHRILLCGIHTRRPKKMKREKAFGAGQFAVASAAQLASSELLSDNGYSHLDVASNLRDLVHVGVIVGGRGSLGSSVGGRDGAVGLVASEVVLHFGIQLLGGLRLRLSRASSLLLVGTCLRSTSGAVRASLRSLRSCALGLLLCGGLGLAVTVSGLSLFVSIPLA